MINRKSIQILRGGPNYDPSTSQEVLADGQPFYSKKTSQLYIGDGKSELKQLKGTAIGLNIENGEGIDSIVQSYSGDVDSTHFGSIVTGESAAAFGEAHSIEGNRTVHFGKMNNSTSANALIVGIGNGRGIEAEPTLEPISGNNIIVCGNNNQNIGAHASIMFGSSGINKGAQSLVGGQNIINEGTCSLVVSYAANGQTAENHATASWLGGDGCYIGPNATSSLVHGQKLICKYGQQKIFGIFNANKSNTLLEIGNGTSDTARSNAFEVYIDGRAKVYGTPREETDVVRKKELDDKFALIMDDKGLTEALDSFKEFQNILISDTAGATGLIDKVSENTEKINQISDGDRIIVKETTDNDTDAVNVAYMKQYIKEHFAELMDEYLTENTATEDEIGVLL